MVTHFVCQSPRPELLMIYPCVRKDLNCRTWDYECDQQLDSQSRVWTLKGAAWNHHQSGCS